LNVPAELKVVVLVLPGVISPVSHRTVSLVEVWLTLSSFLHDTTVPRETVIEDGLNAIPTIPTVLGTGGVVALEVVP
jgi:hypothetical protein